MKITALLMTAILNGVIGAGLAFFLLIAMNGFSESQAMPGLILFIIWVVLTSIITGVLSFLTTKYLINKKFLSAIVSGLIAVVIFVIIGGIFNIIGSFGAILVATALR